MVGGCMLSPGKAGLEVILFRTVPGTSRLTRGFNVIIHAHTIPVFASIMDQKSRFTSWKELSLSANVDVSSVMRIMETMQMLLSGQRIHNFLWIPRQAFANTHKKPKEKSVRSKSFWSLGALIDHMTGSGSKKMRKSVPSWIPRIARYAFMLWQYEAFTFGSQYACNGMQAVKTRPRPVRPVRRTMTISTRSAFWIQSYVKVRIYKSRMEILVAKTVNANNKSANQAVYHRGYPVSPTS